MSETKWEKVFARIMFSVLFLMLVGGISILTAFPFKWCWNYGVCYVWAVPEIEWGHAWCLIFILTMLRTQTVTKD